MGNYILRPEPGRCIGREEIRHVMVEKVVEKQVAPQFDLAALANAVAKAININIQREGVIVNGKSIEDTFDDSKTMAKIADQMTVQRGNSETNFKNLGKIKEVHKNKKETNKTIDLLSKLE